MVSGVCCQCVVLGHGVLGNENGRGATLSTVDRQRATALLEERESRGRLRPGHVGALPDVLQYESVLPDLVDRGHLAISHSRLTVRSACGALAIIW